MEEYTDDIFDDEAQDTSSQDSLQLSIVLQESASDPPVRSDQPESEGDGGDDHVDIGQESDDGGVVNCDQRSGDRERGGGDADIIRERGGGDADMIRESADKGVVNGNKRGGGGSIEKGGGGDHIDAELNINVDPEPENNVDPTAPIASREPNTSDYCDQNRFCQRKMLNIINDQSTVVIRPIKSHGQPNSGHLNSGQPNSGQLVSGQATSGQLKSGQQSSGQSADKGTIRRSRKGRGKQITYTDNTGQDSSSSGQAGNTTQHVG